MTRYILIALLALTFVQGALAQGSPQFEPVLKLFTGLSEADKPMMRESSTEDFVLLEHGELWDMDTLMQYVTPASGERRNFFSLISEQVSGDMALINYWNRALITDEKQELTLNWLESVVVVRRGNDWKLLQMHSTRVDAEKLPKGINFTELSATK